MPILQQEESKPTEEAERMVEVMPFSMGDPIVVAAFGSVLYAWYQFYVKGDTETGLFVGLWAPTLLSAASYIQQKDAVRKLKKGLASF